MGIGGGILGCCGCMLLLMWGRRWGCIGFLGCRRGMGLRGVGNRWIGYTGIEVGGHRLFGCLDGVGEGFGRLVHGIEWKVRLGREARTFGIQDSTLRCCCVLGVASQLILHTTYLCDVAISDLIHKDTILSRCLKLQLCNAPSIKVSPSRILSLAPGSGSIHPSTAARPRFIAELPPKRYQSHH